MHRVYFEDQQVPRPDRWEVPDLRRLANFLNNPLNTVDWISGRFHRVLRRILNNDQHRLQITQLDPERDDIEVARVIKILRTELGYQDSGSWEAKRVLGAGSYGAATLWTKRNDAGEIQDEIVLKDMKHDKSDAHAWFSDPNYNLNAHLPKEAFIQSELNREESENIVHLRGFKTILNPLPAIYGGGIVSDLIGWADVAERLPFVYNRSNANSSQTANISRYRFYLEYCPYGTLETLRARHRFWDLSLPEGFLWHVFDSLAAALVTMESTQPQDGPVAGNIVTWPPSSRVVHFDIKPSNIFLGYEANRDNNPTAYTGGSKYMPFPVIKLGDFGLANITDPYDVRNPSFWWGYGTRGFQAPEMVHYGVDWAAPPNGAYRNPIAPDGSLVTPEQMRRDERHTVHPGFQFMSRMDVWAVAKVMYDLITLSNRSTFQRHWADDEIEFNGANRGRLLPDYQATPFTLGYESDVRGATNPYRPELMALVEKCLHPSINQRPTARELWASTSQQKILWEEQFGSLYRPVQINPDPSQTETDNLAAFELRSTKMPYQGHDINKWEPGTKNFPDIQKDWTAVMKDRFDDYPEETPLNPPRGKWDWWPDRPEFTRGPWNIGDDGRIRFGPMRELRPLAPTPPLNQNNGGGSGGSNRGAPNAPHTRPIESQNASPMPDQDSDQDLQTHGGQHQQQAYGLYSTNEQQQNAQYQQPLHRGYLPSDSQNRQPQNQQLRQNQERSVPNGFINDDDSSLRGSSKLINNNGNNIQNQRSSIDQPSQSSGSQQYDIPYQPQQPSLPPATHINRFRASDHSSSTSGDSPQTNFPQPDSPQYRRAIALSDLLRPTASSSLRGRGCKHSSNKPQRKSQPVVIRKPFPTGLAALSAHTTAGVQARGAKASSLSPKARSSRSGKGSKNEEIKPLASP